MANRLLRDWTGSEAVDQLSEGAEVFFTRLIMKADDFGCYYGNPKLLSSTLYPLKKIAHDRIIKLRDECAKAGVIQIYIFDGKEYLSIPNFGQRLRAMNRKFPEPPKKPVPTDDGPPPSDDRQVTAEEKRREVEVEVEDEDEEKGVADALLFHGELGECWNRWKQHRKEMRKPLTASTLEKQIKFLGGRPPNEAIAIVEQSIFNGWTGLFELKKTTHVNGNTTTRTPQPSTTIIESGKSFGLEKGFSRSGSN